ADEDHVGKIGVRGETIQGAQRLFMTRASIRIAIRVNRARFADMVAIRQRLRLFSNDIRRVGSVLHHMPGISSDPVEKTAASHPTLRWGTEMAGAASRSLSQSTACQNQKANQCRSHCHHQSPRNRTARASPSAPKTTSAWTGSDACSAPTAYP